MSEKLSVTCIDFKPLCKNTLRGFAVIRIEQMRMIMREVAIHVHESGRAWAQPPARPWVKDLRVITNDAGKPQYSPLFEFDSSAVRNGFSDAVIRAVLDYDERALECRENAA